MAATAVISELFDLVSLSKKAAKESKLNPNEFYSLNININHSITEKNYSKNINKRIEFEQR